MGCTAEGTEILEGKAGKQAASKLGLHQRAAGVSARNGRHLAGAAARHLAGATGGSQRPTSYSSKLVGQVLRGKLEEGKKSPSSRMARSIASLRVALARAENANLDDRPHKQIRAKSGTQEWALYDTRGGDHCCK